MKKFIAIAAAAMAFTLSIPAFAQEEDDQPERDERAEQAFADLVEDRVVAGEEKTCLYIPNSNRLNVVDHVGLSYRRGDTLWVARARNPNSISAWDVPIIERFGSQLCRHDVTRTIDRSSGFFSGVVFLENWVPYRKAEDIDG